MEEMVDARCMVCDAPFKFPKKIVGGMKLPSTFCRRCFNLYDPLTLRQWYKLDSIIHYLQNAATAPRQDVHAAA